MWWACVRLLLSPTSLLKRTGKIPIMSAQSSQQVCLVANNKLISLDSDSQLTQTPHTYLPAAISSPLSPHCLRLVIEGQFVMAGPKCNLCRMTGALLSADFLISAWAFVFPRLMMCGWDTAHYSMKNNTGCSLLTLAKWWSGSTENVAQTIMNSVHKFGY